MKYRAIDLFAGIGGIRLGFQKVFGDELEFVFSSEIDPNCQQTYKANFHEVPMGDITQVAAEDIPDFDILLAGFPCQAFSIAGFQKGFEDTRGTLFYEIARILEAKKPAAFFLENVENLKNHDQKRTFRMIRKVLESDLKYFVHHKILNAKYFGLPQNRPRIYIIGFKHQLKFKFPRGSKDIPKLSDILEKEVAENYYLSQEYLNGLKKHKERHQNKGHGFGYEILDPNGVAYTLVLGGMGRERNLIKDKIPPNAFQDGEDDLRKRNNEGIRKLTEREFGRLQGFPDDFIIPVSMTQAYRQFANSVPIPVVTAIAREIKKSLDSQIKGKGGRQSSFDDYR